MGLSADGALHMQSDSIFNRIEEKKMQQFTFPADRFGSAELFAGNEWTPSGDLQLFFTWIHF